MRADRPISGSLVWTSALRLFLLVLAGSTLGLLWHWLPTLQEQGSGTVMDLVGARGSCTYALEGGALLNIPFLQVQRGDQVVKRRWSRTYEINGRAQRADWDTGWSRLLAMAAATGAAGAAFLLLCWGLTATVQGLCRRR